MKSPRHRIAGRARADLDQIWIYIAEHDANAADRPMRKLRQRFAAVARMPGIGCRRSELRADLRSVAVGNYVIFHREWDQGVAIARVLHGAMNLSGQFR